MHRFTGGLAVAAIVAAASPAHAATEDAQVWTSIAVSGRVADKLLVGGDVVGRYADDARRLGQLVLRAQVGTPLGKRVTVWVGYAHSTTYDSRGRATIEERSFEQVNWSVGTIGRARLSTRTRLEQRFQRGAAATSWRLRQQLRVVVPLRRDGPSAVVTVEPLVTLNRTGAVASGIDQVRGFAGLSFPLTKAVDLEAGYLNQYLVRMTGDRSNHTLSIAMNYRF